MPGLYDTTILCSKAKVTGVVAHACDFSTEDTKQKDHEFEASLGYIVRSYLKNKIFLGSMVICVARPFSMVRT
jgi:hypothetical protein